MVVTREDERLFVLDRYKLVNAMLEEIEKLLNENAPKEAVQAKYGQMKYWCKAEYNTLAKNRHDGGYIQTIYAPLIEDIYVQAFDRAKTNSPIEKIGVAIYDGRDYYMYWSAQLNEVIR